MSNRSCIWHNFDVSLSDNTKAVCKVCRSEVSRGGKTAKTFSPTNLKTHLQRTHLKEYNEYTEKIKQEVAERKRKSDSSSSTTSLAKQVFRQQQTIGACLQRSQKWADDNAHKIECDRLLGEMIALDVQPFTITQDVGFQRLVAKLEPRYTLPSPNHLSRTVIPGITQCCRMITQCCRIYQFHDRYMVISWIPFSDVLKPLDHTQGMR